MPAIVIPAAYWAVGGLLALAGTIAWQRSGGPERTAQAMNDLANSMAEAEENAAVQSRSGTTATATTCIGACRPNDPECGPLYDEIARLTRELAQRRADMLRDTPQSRNGLGMYELFLRDPYASVPNPAGGRPYGSWTGHRDQIEQKQINLQSKIARYRAKPCTPLPPGAETQAYLPTPTKPFYMGGS